MKGCLGKEIGKVYRNKGLKQTCLRTLMGDVENEDIDLFFIDINLPDGSGIELAKAIRSRSRYELKGIVFLTTEAYQVVTAFKTTHCYDYLIKPYDEEDIKNVIKVFTKQTIK